MDQTDEGPVRRQLPAYDSSAPQEQSGEHRRPVAATGGQPAQGQVATLHQGDLIGTTYEIIRPIGSGGFGRVYLARDRKLARLVAIKVLGSVEPELLRRFVIEARATAQCTHENIVVIHEVGEHQGAPYMVLEYLEGKTLAELRDTRLSLSRVIEIMTAVVRALVRAHAEGIVHRDLKPENILLCDSGSIKVLDFGIAKLPRAELEPESRGKLAEPAAAHPGTAIAGTVPYMAPEQWIGGQEIDHRTDIWAVGIMLYEFLVGQHPLAHHPDPRAWVTDFSRTFPGMQSLAPELPDALVAVVERCLNKPKAQRYPDAAALLRALEPFLPGQLSWHANGTTSPFAGLRSFQEDDAPRFFGRSREIAALVERLSETPLVGVVGMTGVGKSSVLRAGAIPALKRSNGSWLSLTVRPGRDPLGVLAHLLAPFFGIQRADEQHELRERLLQEPGLFGTVLRAVCARDRQRMVLLVDQFEELFTLGADAAAQRAFKSCLVGAADDAASPLRVVLAMRADFLGRVADDPAFIRELSKGLFVIGPPTPEGLREALTRPAESAGYHFESEALLQQMVEYLQRSPAGLPLLQFAAEQLWEKRDASRHQLTQRAYDELGGVAGALAKHAEQVIEALPPASVAACRGILVQLVTAERTRVVISVNQLRELVPHDDDLFDSVLNELVKARLLVIRSEEGEPVVELVHESLITTWPTLARWLDQGQEDRAFLSELLSAARQWEAKKRVKGLLWGDDMVPELERFERRYQGGLPRLAREFSQTVIAMARRSARRRVLLRRWSIAVLLGMLATATAGLIVVRRWQLEAAQSAKQLQVAELAEKAAKESYQNANALLTQQKAALTRSLDELARSHQALSVNESNLLQKTEQLEQQRAELVLQKEQLENALSQLKSASRSAQEAKRAADKSARRAAYLQHVAEDRAARVEAQVGPAVPGLK